MIKILICILYNLNIADKASNTSQKYIYIEIGAEKTYITVKKI